ncbi:hypothetical protein I553_10674 [Mycobacterium xenopi 4042]|uniref:Uncharacterized protein n=1 Tax=Mycobacterium xenopi 4042 TaxID=1299334 RepID=X8DXQ9_MYCXE|nr:hypothetical protein I553_10674 [Mycobacterium xenopi 4042]
MMSCLRIGHRVRDDHALAFISHHTVRRSNQASSPSGIHGDHNAWPLPYRWAYWDNPKLMVPSHANEPFLGGHTLVQMCNSHPVRQVNTGRIHDSPWRSAQRTAPTRRHRTPHTTTT